MISNRLIEISKLTKGFNTLLDVGSDHGWLPIYAIKNNFVCKAIASDINEKPLLNAKKNIEDNNLDIELINCDGIPKTNADVIVIAGMGAELMIEILEKTLCNAINLKRLVLSPNCDYDILRKYMNHKFRIVDEIIIYDKKHFYEAIAYDLVGESYNCKELYFGPILMKKKDELFIKKYKLRLDKLNEIVDGITNEEKKKEIEKEIKMIKEMI